MSSVNLTKLHLAEQSPPARLLGSREPPSWKIKSFWDDGWKREQLSLERNWTVFKCLSRLRGVSASWESSTVLLVLLTHLAFQDGKTFVQSSPSASALMFHWSESISLQHSSSVWRVEVKKLLKHKKQVDLTEAAKPNRWLTVFSFQLPRATEPHYYWDMNNKGQS